MELKILLYISSNFKNAFFDFGMPFISFFSNKGWIWIAIAVGLLLTKKYRRYGVALSIGLALCLVMGNVILKSLVARPRPYDVYGEIELLIEKLSDFSFPSGHTYSAFCGATILYFMNRKIGYAAFAFAVLTAFSRLYLFVHYPTDVLAGIVMGVAVAFLAMYILKDLERRFQFGRAENEVNEINDINEINET